MVSKGEKEGGVGGQRPTERPAQRSMEHVVCMGSRFWEKRRKQWGSVLLSPSSKQRPLLFGKFCIEKKHLAEGIVV